MFKLRLVLLASVAVLPLAPAFAQTADQPAAAGGAIALPTVEVTATDGGGEGGGFGGAGPAQDPYNTTYELKDASTGTKTDTPVMDTPLNVQSVTQQVLRDQQAITLDQALQNVSGVFVSPGSVTGTGTPGNRITIRGFDISTIYRDGFRMDFSQAGGDFANFLQLANVASIEVLKGPGAILYGLSEPGGVVNLVTKEPLNVPYYSVQQQVGSLALYRTTVDATGPLNDDKTLLYRMNMSYENNGAPFGSFIDLTHSQNLFLAPVVKWNIDPQTWVKLESQYSQTNGSLFFSAVPVVNGFFVPEPRNRNYGEYSPELQTSLFSALTWSHQFDNDWSVKQQIAYLNLHNNNNPLLFPADVVQTPDGTQAIVRGIEPSQFAQSTYSTNVDITGHIDTFGAKHTLLIGGDYYHTLGNTAAIDQNVSLIDLWNPVHPGFPIPPGTISLTCPGCGDVLAPPTFSASSYTQDTAGLYVQDQIKLPYNFFLLGGARYQYIHQTSATGLTPDTLAPGGTPLEAQAVTPRVGLLWRPEDWVSFYGDYTEGFGPNSGLIFPGTPAPPTSAQSWEAGLKLEFFDGRLRATADYFDLLKTNVPTTDPNPAHTCGGSGCVILVGEGRSNGVELDVQGQILPGWNVIVTYTNQNVRVVKAGDQFGFGLIQDGDRFPGVPQNLASLWTTYEFQDETLKGLKIGGGYIYHGSQTIFDLGFNAPNTIPLLPSWGTVDLMAAYSFKFAGTKLTAQLNITNLFDTTYYTGTWNFTPIPGIGYARRTYGAPFAALGSLRAEF
jgi:iron complex outermembrane recepter protein